MGTTDAKPGFRLPWSADRSEAGDQADTTAESTATADRTDDTTEMGAATTDAAAETDVTPSSEDSTDAAEASASTDEAAEDAVASQPGTGTDTPPTAEAETTATAEVAPAPTIEPEPAPARKPNKFMAELTKAMQAAAETARGETLDKFAADAKTHIEAIHASTADEATDLRKKADDDIAAIREWSKAEIARIREETDERIAHRKTVLEREVDAHAAEIETRIDHVQRRVSAFEREMADFFDRLLGEDDPTRFAAMAERLPEPPAFDADAWEPQGLIGVDEGAAGHDRLPDEAGDVETTTTDTEASGDAIAEATSDISETELAVDTPAAESGAADAADLGEVTDRWSLAADPVPDADPTAGGGWDVGASWSEQPDARIGTVEPADERAEDRTEDRDLRLDALGLGTDLAAAEAEAAEYAPAGGSDDDIPIIADDALAARLSGLVHDVEAGATELATTNVVVTGLISVASIAGFKRHLSRVPGVGSVGVSSGPDGEFVFAVGHVPELALGDAITTLPGFGARVTGDREGELVVTARDPETEG